MTDPFLRHVERMNGCDDIDCQGCGGTVRPGESCDECGWEPA